MSPVRVAVVGAGAIAQVAHLPALRRLNGVDIAAICDNDAVKARALASRFGVPDVYDDIEDLVRNARLDAVVLCTPNHMHESHAVAALAAGVHVFAERPLALSVAGAERVIQASERYGKRVIVAMNHRFRSDVQAVRGFLSRGELGPIEAVRGGWHAYQSPRDVAPWRLRPQQAGGGAFVDLGLPLLDLGLWLSGWPAPIRVSAALVRHGADRVEEMGTVIVTCANGLLVTLDVSWRHLVEGEQFWFELACAKGAAGIQPLRIVKDAHGAPTDVTPTGAAGRETLFAQSYRAEWMYFLAVIRGEVNAPPPKDQLLLQRVVDAVYRSAAEGREVTP